ncbi:MAG TPA: sulfatase-like hydrolase/transferase [Luteimonas sp.]|nr:sulfatase-like hydrolase/transferase [Luteimonas sp.]
MNTPRPPRSTDAHPVDERDWLAQERALPDPSGDRRDAVLARALRTMPVSRPPADFAAEVARLAAAGFSTRTAFSDAPVYGGKSWLSVATVQTGVRIETPSLYDEMEPSAARLGTITNFFKSQGYRTVSLQPGNYRNDMRFPDPYARDRQYAFKDLRYNGPAYGYVGVPDQHSLRVFTEDVLSQERGPTFMFYLSISTHHPFPSIPFEGGGPWPSIPGVEAIPADGAHRAYFNTVEYEWRCLLEFIDRVADDDAVFFIIGDHQPLLERTMDDVQELTVLQSSNTPVHVISRNAAFLQRFEKYGFQPGLAPPPGTGGLRHEGLASLFVHEFVGQFGGEAQQRHTQYYPDGIGLGGLVAPASRDVGAGSERDGAQEQQGR